MIIEDRLEILDNFVVDYDLPKFRELQRKAKKGIDLTAYADDSGFTIDEEMNIWNPMMSQSKASSPWWHKLAFWRFWKKADKGMPVLEFFRHIKNSSRELVIVEGRAQGFKLAIERARANGQKALETQLMEGIRAYKAETQMLAMGLTEYLEEEDIVKFAKQAKKGLRLDYIRLFTRQIPDDVAEVKSRADELKIFDNYAILHYDPEGKGHVEEKKDPILFGLLKGKRRLYFVGDWVDEYCDLTMDQIADVLGNDVIKDIEDLEP